MDTSQNPGQADEVDGTQDSQQTPTQDSEIQTSQPDQPIPSESERQAAGTTGSVGPSGQPAEGTVSGSQFPSGAEQQAAQDQREQELEAQRREHNEGTGGGDVNEGERQEPRDEHNARTDGEQTDNQ